MSIEAINLAITLLAMAVTAGGSVTYMRTKISTIENDLINLKEDTINNIEASYNKLQIFIKKMEENLTTIRQSIDKVESNLEKELISKLDGHKNETILTLKRLENNHETLDNSFSKFKELIFSKHDSLKEDFLNMNSRINEVDNNCKLITKEYLTKAEASDIYIRRDIFGEKEAIHLDRLNEVKRETGKNVTRINKIENNLVEFLTMFKFNRKG